MSYLLNHLMAASMMVFMTFVLINVSRLIVVFIRHPSQLPQAHPYQRKQSILLWFNPIIMAQRHFHIRENRPWAVGYVLYHIAIITLVMGYALSFTMLMYRLAHGEAIPLPAPYRDTFQLYHYLLPIFGNGEKVYSDYLFGGFSSAFQLISWSELLIAIAGNICLLVGWLRSARNKRNRPLMQLITRAIIFLIIQTEIVGRLTGWEHAVIAHIILGLILFSLIPFTFLRHIIFFPFVAYLVHKRRRFEVMA